MTTYQHIQVPPAGQNITVNADQTLNVPNQPIIPFIQGDGVGVDVSPVMRKVVDAAVAQIYRGQRQIHWMEIYAGEKAVALYGPDMWLPAETMDVFGPDQEDLWRRVLRRQPLESAIYSTWTDDPESN